MKGSKGYGKKFEKNLTFYTATCFAAFAASLFHPVVSGGDGDGDRSRVLYRGGDKKAGIYLCYGLQFSLLILTL
jgi:hypothetical protein